MSLKNLFPKSIPEPIRAIGEKILSEDSVYRLVGQQGDDIITDADFIDLYAEEGRSGINPVLLTFVTVFQFLEKLPDRKAAEMAVMRLDWKYALRQDLEWTGFHYSDLSNFRKRLLNNQQEMLIFEKVISYLGENGYIKAKGKQRTDATHILGKVKNLSRLELVSETIRLAVGALISADARWSLYHLPSPFVEKHSSRRNEYNLSKKKIKQEMQAAGEAGYWLVERVSQSGEELKDLPEIECLKRVLEEQFSQKDHNTPPVARPNSDCGGDKLQTPHDPDVRYSSKRGQGWKGYKMQVSETLAEDQSARFISDIEITSAIESDQKALEPIQQRLIQREIPPEKQYVDQGYMSGEHIHTSQERNIDLRGFVSTGNSPKEEGFRLANFVIDMERQQAICPAGKTSLRWTEVRPETTKAVAYRAFFGKQCRTCPFFSSGQCTTLSSGRRLDISRYHHDLQTRRQEMKTKAFQQEMHTRNGIEGTISELVRAHGARHSRYRGLAKNQLQAGFIGVAINLKRLAKAFDLLYSARKWAFSA